METCEVPIRVSIRGCYQESKKFCFTVLGFIKDDWERWKLEVKIVEETTAKNTIITKRGDKHE